MQEVLKKIIERSREEKLNVMLPDGFRDECITIKLLETIVNQVAEEYRNNSVDVCTVFDILDQFHMFQGQRAGRELWSNKPEAVQNKDIENFNRNLQVIRNYVKSTAHINCSTDKSIELLSRAKGACNHTVCDEVMSAYKKILEEYSNSEIPNMSEKLTNSNDGWIPVSERLPDKSGEYIVQNKFGITFAYFCEPNKNPHFNTIGVVAWMPKPPKYQPKGE